MLNEEIFVDCSTRPELKISHSKSTEPNATNNLFIDTEELTLGRFKIRKTISLLETKAPKTIQSGRFKITYLKRETDYDTKKAKINVEVKAIDKPIKQSKKHEFHIAKAPNASKPKHNFHITRHPRDFLTEFFGPSESSKKSDKSIDSLIDF